MASKISLFADAEGMQRQIIDLRAANKSRYFAIAVFNNCFITQFIISRPFPQVNTINRFQMLLDTLGW